MGTAARRSPSYPEVADLIARDSPDTLLCAAGGIADGRGLAAALTLGADGVVVGSRLWATEEAQVSQGMRDAALAADGDATLRTSVVDIARSLDWPERFTARVLRNGFTERWHGHEDGAARATGTRRPEAWRAGWAAGDPDRASTFIGEAAGLIDDDRARRRGDRAHERAGRRPPAPGNELRPPG